MLCRTDPGALELDVNRRPPFLTIRVRVGDGDVHLPRVAGINNDRNPSLKPPDEVASVVPDHPVGYGDILAEVIPEEEHHFLVARGGVDVVVSTLHLAAEVASIRRPAIRIDDAKVGKGPDDEHDDEEGPAVRDEVLEGGLPLLSSSDHSITIPVASPSTVWGYRPSSLIYEKVK